MKFDIVWGYCIQEESRVTNREALLIKYDQALATHTKGRKQSNFRKSNHNPSKKKIKKKKKDYSKYQCYNFHKIWNLSRECTSPKKINNKNET